MSNKEYDILFSIPTLEETNACLRQEISKDFVSVDKTIDIVNWGFRMTMSKGDQIFNLLLGQHKVNKTYCDKELRNLIAFSKSFEIVVVKAGCSKNNNNNLGGGSNDLQNLSI